MSDIPATSTLTIYPTTPTQGKEVDVITLPGGYSDNKEFSSITPQNPLRVGDLSGADSLNKPLPVPKKPGTPAAATGPTSPTTSSLVSSATSAATSAVSSLVPGGLEADIAKFNDPSQVEEVTVNSGYYPPTQPFLPQFKMQFADTVDEATIKQTTTPGSPLPIFTPETPSPVPPAPSFDFTSTNTSSLSSLEPSFVKDSHGNSYLDSSAVPNHFISMQYRNVFLGVGFLTLTLFDPKWDDIEQRLIKSKGFFRFQYGYMGPDAAGAQSPWYVAKCYNYKIDFGMEGTTLSISAITTGYSMTFTKVSASLNLKGELISDTALNICNAFDVNYIPVIEKTAPVKSREAMEGTDEINKLLSMTGETYIKVILNQLVKYAVNEQGQGNYGFFIRTTKEGKKEFHFHTINYDPQKSPLSQSSQAVSSPSLKDQANAAAGLPADTPGDTKLTPEQSQKAAAFINQKRAEMNSGKDINPTTSSIPSTTPSTTLATKTPAFTRFRNKNSAMITFTPSWQMSVVQLTGGGGTSSVIIDMTTKNASVTLADMDSFPQKFDNATQITKLEFKDYIPKPLQGNDVLAGFSWTFSAARNEEQNDAIVGAKFSKNYPGGITANLEIVGTPNFYVTQKVAAFIFKPQGDNKTATTSNVHWISGFYRIKGITDRIIAGKYTTILELVSDGRSLVDLEKVKALPAASSTTNVATPVGQGSGPPAMTEGWQREAPTVPNPDIATGPRAPVETYPEELAALRADQQVVEVPYTPSGTGPGNGG